MLPLCYKPKKPLYKNPKILYSTVRTNPAGFARRRYRYGMPQYVCRTWFRFKEAFKKFFKEETPMRNLKKVLVLVLSLAMLMSIMVTGAAAAFTDQGQIDTQHKEAVDMCVSLNIINGMPDGSFNPTGDVTRAEISKMICIALNGGEVPTTATKATPTFTDIKGHWAEGFIEYCYTKGVVAGVGNNQFDPEGKVTGTQAAKMLLVALGWNSDVEKYTGANWELNVNVQANQDGLYKKLGDIDAAAPLNREHTAQMVWNALQAYIVNKSSQIDRTTGDVTDVYTQSTVVDLLEKMYEGDIIEGRLLGFTYNSNDKDWTYDVQGAAPLTFKSKTDYTDLLGQKVKAVYDMSKSGNTKDAYGIFVTDSSVVFEGVVGDLPNITKNTDNSFKVAGVTYKLDNTMTGTPVYAFDGANWNTAYDVATLWALAGQPTPGVNISLYDSQNIKGIDYDGNGKIDFIQVCPFSVGKVTYVSSSEFRVSYKDIVAGATTTTATLKFDDVNAYSGLAKDDYVKIVWAANTADDTTTFTKVTPISGNVAKYSSGDLTVDGSVYTMDDSYPVTSGGAAASNIAAGADLTDAVVVNGYVFYVDKADKTSVTDYAVVCATEAGGVNGSQAKLLFTDGAKTVVPTDKNYTSFANGTLVTWSKNSDGDYILKKATTPVTGYDLAQQGTSVNVTKVSNSSDKAGYVAGAYIDNDSVIFITYESGSYKVITGEQMKKMDATEFVTFGEGYVLGTKTSGSNHVDMAYVSVGTKSINDADTYYGYITASGIVQNGDKNQVFEVTVWTKDGEHTYQTANTGTSGAVVGTDNAKMAKRQVIEYKLNSDGKISEVKNSWRVDQTANVVSGTDAASTVAITSSSPTLKVQLGSGTAVYDILPGSPAATGGKQYMDLDSDTIYLYIENTDCVGAEAVTISNADDSATAGMYVQNAFIVLDKDGDIALLVYDVDNEIAQ